MLRYMNPPAVVQPFSRYSQGVEMPGPARWVHVSGQIGATKDGKIEQGFEAQARRAWLNVMGVLEATGMSAADIVKYNVYLTRREDVASARGIRDEMMKGYAAASTLVVISALAHPDLLIEVEAIAAKAVASEITSARARHAPQGEGNTQADAQG